MTMQEQVLTLFGGWARARIPQPIEAGVDKPSVTLSASTFISSNNTDEWLEEKIREAHGRQLVSVDIDKLSITIVAQKAWFNPDTRKEHIIDMDVTRLKREVTDPDGRVREIPSPWVDTIHMTWVHVAFLRFFELWGHGTSNDMHRGFLSKEPLKRSFSGMIGTNNAEVKGRKDRALGRRENGEWYLKNKADLYPKVRRLPEEGIANARAHARALRQQRLAGK